METGGLIEVYFFSMVGTVNALKQVKFKREEIKKMHDLSIIKRLNQEKQDEHDGKEVIKIKPDIRSKTESRQLFFRELYKRQSDED